MKRFPEPELMTDPAQAKAYANADFDEPHSQYIELVKKAFGEEFSNGYVLDLGCGPGDISFRIANAFPHCTVHGIDGAKSMLDWAKHRLLQHNDLKDRLQFILGNLPDVSPPRPQYDAVISNSLLHHLADPQVLWKTIKRYAGPGSPVFIMDLLRPSTKKKAEDMICQYAASEPYILQRDFYYSLLAAFEIREIEQQLIEAQLTHFCIEQVSNRHVIIYGKV